MWKLLLMAGALLLLLINKQNEKSMRAASQWLTDHPEYRSDLVDGATDSKPAHDKVG